MTNEERDIISQFITRVSGAPVQSGFAGGSVPPTQPALPPVDRDADALIGQMFQQYPESRYRITQLAFVQERALVEAQNRIKRLEWEVQQTQQALQQAQQQAGQQQNTQQPGGSSGGGGFFSGLFGGGNRQQSAPPPGGAWNRGAQPQQPNYYQPSAPPPQPQYPPNYQQAPLPRQGSGFLGSALTTAAGVAGGMVAGNALMSLFSPHEHSFGGGEYGGGFGGAPAGGPWGGGPAEGQNFVDTGSWNDPAAGGGGGGGGGDQNYVDNGSWDQSAGGVDPTPPDDSGSWDPGGGGGWDNSGGGGSDDTF